MQKRFRDPPIIKMIVTTPIFWKRWHLGPIKLSLQINKFSKIVEKFPLKQVEATHRVEDIMWLHFGVRPKSSVQDAVLFLLEFHFAPSAIKSVPNCLRGRLQQVSLLFSNWIELIQGTVIAPVFWRLFPKLPQLSYDTSREPNNLSYRRDFSWTSTR